MYSFPAGLNGSELPYSWSVLLCMELTGASVYIRELSMKENNAAICRMLIVAQKRYILLLPCFNFEFGGVHKCGRYAWGARRKFPFGPGRKRTGNSRQKSKKLHIFRKFPAIINQMRLPKIFTIPTRSAEISRNLKKKLLFNLRGKFNNFAKVIRSLADKLIRWCEMRIDQ